MKKLFLVAMYVLYNSCSCLVLADDLPFGMFLGNETYSIDAETEVYFATFDEQSIKAQQLALAEYEASEKLQKEYEEQLRVALVRRSERRALREAEKCDETSITSYKLRNRYAKVIEGRQTVPFAENALQKSATQSEARAQAARQERLKTFAIKQAQVLEQAHLAEQEMLALCQELEIVRSKVARYSNALPSAIMN